MTTPRQYAIQDGGQFYIFDEGHDDEPVAIEEYPGKVSDYDMNAAGAARKWFDRLYEGRVKVRAG